MRSERKSDELNRSTAFDNKLRPTDFSGFVGQEKIRDRLMLAVKAAKERGDEARFTVNFFSREFDVRAGDGVVHCSVCGEMGSADGSGNVIVSVQ